MEATIGERFEILKTPDRAESGYRWSSLEGRTRVAGDNADQLLTELRLVGVDHRRQPPREVGFRLGRDEQDFGPAAGDLPDP
jgi:hypothetical protein